MHPQALGYVGIRAKNTEDWRATAAACSACSASTRAARRWRSAWTTASSASSSMRMAARASSFFGWEVADAAALERVAAQLESGRRPGGARLARARRRAARQGPDRAQRSGRQPAGAVPRRRDHARAVQARPHISGFRTGAARSRPRGDALSSEHRRRAAVLPRPARLPPDATTTRSRSRRRSCTSIRATISLAFIETGKNAVHHMMMELIQLRRRRPGLRHRAGRGGPRRHHARPPHQRLHHVVLFLDAVGLHGRVRLGRARHRRRDLAGLRAQGRPEHVGPRPHLAVAGGAGRGARRCGCKSPTTASASPCR